MLSTCWHMFPDIENFVDTIFRQAGSLSDSFQAVSFRSEGDDLLLPIGFGLLFGCRLSFWGSVENALSIPANIVRLLIHIAEDGLDIGRGGPLG